MALKKCPICDNFGKITITNTSTYPSTLIKVCPTCNGSCVVDENTGLPATNSLKSSKDNFSKVENNDIEK